MTEYVSESPENIMMNSQGWALITSGNEHVAQLMKVGHKCNKAAKVIRSATGHFEAAHTPHIGLWREIWWTAEVELVHLQRTREGLMACDCVHSHILILMAATSCLVKDVHTGEAVCAPLMSEKMSKTKQMMKHIGLLEDQFGGE